MRSVATLAFVSATLVACSGTDATIAPAADESDLTSSDLTSGRYDAWIRAHAHDYGDQTHLVNSAHQGFNPVNGALSSSVEVAEYTYHPRLEDVADLTISTKAFRPVVLVVGGSCAKPIGLLGTWKTDHYEVEKDISDLRCDTNDTWTAHIYVTSTKNLQGSRAVSSGAFTWQYDNLE